MFRKSLIHLLTGRPWSVAELARRERLNPAEIEEDLRHIARSLRHTSSRLHVEPARCRKCGFTFDDGHFGKPSRCPACRGTWIADARVRIETTASVPEDTGEARADAGEGAGGRDADGGGGRDVEIGGEPA